MLGAGAAQTLGIDRLNPAIAIWIGQRWFTVIGILRSSRAIAPELDQVGARRDPLRLYRFLAADTHPTTIDVGTDPNQTLAVRDVLARTANPENPQDVSSVSRPSDALAAQIAAKGAYNTLLLGLGAIALLVGAVGIANVMVMAIIQRRAEIGLRRALGATRRHVAIQFTAEALHPLGTGRSGRNPRRNPDHSRLCTHPPLGHRDPARPSPQPRSQPPSPSD